MVTEEMGIIEIWRGQRLPKEEIAARYPPALIGRDGTGPGLSQTHRVTWGPLILCRNDGAWDLSQRIKLSNYLQAWAAFTLVVPACLYLAPKVTLHRAVKFTMALPRKNWTAPWKGTSSQLLPDSSLKSTNQPSPFHTNYVQLQDVSPWMASLLHHHCSR